MSRRDSSPLSGLHLVLADPNRGRADRLARRLVRCAAVDCVDRADDGPAAVALARTTGAQVVMVDRAQAQAALALTEDQDDPIEVIVFIDKKEVESAAWDALAWGAAAVLRHETSADEVCEAARSATEGGSVVSPILARQLVTPFRRGDTRLTTREVEVLARVADGLSNRDIACRLGVSPSTVGTHLEHIYRKLGASNRTEAAALALARGLLPATTDGDPFDPGSG